MDTARKVVDRTIKVKDRAGISIGVADRTNKVVDTAHKVVNKTIKVKDRGAGYYNKSNE
ncbi:hypothetical protein ACULLL_17815 [Lysinibacillus irui]|uniref:hypothetical protein n=1 Tax=Lysinibacillus irui TaxID=2998077 RepID=UPI00404408BB